MASKCLGKALNWILESDNAKAFHNDFNTVMNQVSDLSPGDIDILKKIHQKGMPEAEKLLGIEVSGQRSYGWSEPDPPKN